MARWHTTDFDFLPAQAFQPRGWKGSMTLEGGGKGSSPAAPDYAPMAAASEKSAQLASDLGNKQLAQNQSQYDQNMATVAPLVAKQGAIMDQSMAQAQDYYNYNKSASRPVEQAINDEAMASGSEQRQGEAADRAVADSRAGTTASANMIARQGLRYGFSPEKMASMAGDMSANQGLAQATAANGARTAEKNLGYARKLDAAGLYRGLTGASTAAYGVASGAGSAGTSGQLGMSGQFMNGMNAGTSTIMNGQQLAQQGIGSILNAQSNMYQSPESTGSMLGGIGGLAGGIARLWR